MLLQWLKNKSSEEIMEEQFEGLTEEGRNEIIHGIENIMI